MAFKATELQNRIVAELKSDKPPANIPELAWRVRAKEATVRSYMSHLLNAGDLVITDIPWRKHAPDGKTHVPDLPSIGLPAADTPLADVEAGLRLIIDSNGPDRVAAYRLLTDIRTLNIASDGPPAPRDRASQLSALTRLLSALPTDLINEALALLPPPETEAANPEAPKPAA